MENLQLKRWSEVFYLSLQRILLNTEFAWLTTEQITDEMRYVEIAYLLAKIKHKPDIRKDGRRYFEHIKSVIEIVIKELPNPTVRKAILAALHDLYEDWRITLATIRDIFSDEIAEQVQLLSKRHFTYYLDEQENDILTWKSEKQIHDYLKQHKSRIKKLINDSYYEDLFRSKDDDVISVKIADRIHNLRDKPWAGDLQSISNYIQETENYIITWLKKFWDTYNIWVTKLEAQIANLKLYVHTAVQKSKVIFVINNTDIKKDDPLT